jgi:hypothetical protein
MHPVTSLGAYPSNAPRIGIRSGELFIDGCALNSYNSVGSCQVRYPAISGSPDRFVSIRGVFIFRYAENDPERSRRVTLDFIKTPVPAIRPDGVRPFLSAAFIPSLSDLRFPR